MYNIFNIKIVQLQLLLYYYFILNASNLKIVYVIKRFSVLRSPI